jgi:cathepsin D
VQFDTGSSDIWVTSALCNSTNCDGHRRYDPHASKTAVDLNKTAGLGYGDGNVTVEQYVDTVSIAGFTVCIASQLNPPLYLIAQVRCIIKLSALL